MNTNFSLHMRIRGRHVERTTAVSSVAAASPGGDSSGRRTEKRVEMGNSANGEGRRDVMNSVSITLLACGTAKRRAAVPQTAVAATDRLMEREREEVAGGDESS